MTDKFFVPLPKKEIESEDDLFREMEILNKRKRILKFDTSRSPEPEKFAKDWLKLAGEYSELNCIANTSYCVLQYRRLGGDEDARQYLFSPSSEAHGFYGENFPDTEDPVHHWQTRADIGDD